MDDENDDLPTPIEDAPVTCSRCHGDCRGCHSDSDNIRDKEVPGMMERFEFNGFEVTVTLVPKREFDEE